MATCPSSIVMPLRFFTADGPPERSHRVVPSARLMSVCSRMLYSSSSASMLKLSVPVVAEVKTLRLSEVAKHACSTLIL